MTRTIVERFEAAIHRVPTLTDQPNAFTLHRDGQRAHEAGDYVVAAEKYSQASWVALTQSGAKELAEQAAAEWELAFALQGES